LKKFQFSLQTLLHAYKQRENMAKKNLQEAELLLHHETTILEKYEKALSRTYQHIKMLQKGNPSAQVLQEWQEFLKGIKAKIEQHKDYIAQARLAVQWRQKEVIQAMRRRKTMDNLQERRSMEWDNEQMEKERYELDELSTIRYSWERQHRKRSPPETHTDGAGPSLGMF
jgi:flagellar export protein FliJ